MLDQLRESFDRLIWFQPSADTKPKEKPQEHAPDEQAQTDAPDEQARKGAQKDEPSGGKSLEAENRRLRAAVEALETENSRLLAALADLERGFRGQRQA